MFFSPFINFMSLINREKLCVNREKSAPKIHHSSPLVFHRLRPHDQWGVQRDKLHGTNGANFTVSSLILCRAKEAQHARGADFHRKLQTFAENRWKAEFWEEEIRHLT